MVVELEQTFYSETFWKRYFTVGSFFSLLVIVLTFLFSLAIASSGSERPIHHYLLMTGVFLLLIIFQAYRRWVWCRNSLVSLVATNDELTVRYLEFDQEKEVQIKWDDLTLTDEGTETIPSSQVIVFRSTDGTKLKFYDITYQPFGQEAMEKLVVDINRIKTKYATPTTKWVL